MSTSFGFLFKPNLTWAPFALQSPKKVGDDIAKATGDWKGLRITVKLTIQNRQAAVCIQSPHIVLSSDLNRAESDCDADFRLRWFPLHRLWSSKLWRSLLVTGRRSRTVSDIECKPFPLNYREDGQRDRLTISHLKFPVKHTGSVSFDEIVSVARVMRPRSIARELSGKMNAGWGAQPPATTPVCLSDWV